MALYRIWCSYFLMPRMFWNMSYNCSLVRIISDVGGSVEDQDQDRTGTESENWYRPARRRTRITSEKAKIVVEQCQKTGSVLQAGG